MKNIVAGLKKCDYNAQVGINPMIGIFPEKLLEKPAISWANVGRVPNENFLSRITSAIKGMVGWRWANTIEGIMFYKGSRYIYPFHVAIEWGKMSGKRNKYNGYLPDVSSAKRYSFEVFDPLNGMQLFHASGELKKWNARINPKDIEAAKKAIRLFEGVVMSQAKTAAEDYRKRKPQ